MMIQETRRTAPTAATAPIANAIAVASGKGGVGKTWLSITLAHALANLGRRTVLIDGDLGLANVDIQLGLTPPVDLGSILESDLPVERAIVRYVQGGFDVIAGRSGSAFATNAAVSPASADAVRHIFAIGVVTLAITAMAQLILPEFASERLLRRTAPWRGAGFALALSTAVVLRGLLPLTPVPDAVRFWTMAARSFIGRVQCLPTPRAGRRAECP